MDTSSRRVLPGLRAPTGLATRMRNVSRGFARTFALRPVALQHGVRQGAGPQYIGPQNLALRIVAMLVPVVACVGAASVPWLAGCSRADAASESAGRGRRLEAGKPVEVTLDLRKRAFADFNVEVPAGTVALRWRLTTRRVELGLRTRRGTPLDDDTSTDDWRTTSENGRALVLYDRFTVPAIGADHFYARVEWPYDVRPRTVGERLDEVSFTLVAEVESTRVDGALPLPASVRGRIDTEHGSFRAYTVEVPEGTSALRFDLADAPSDLDLYAKAGAPILALDESVHFAQHGFGRETLVIEGEDGAPLAPGTWYVEVVDAFDVERPIDFTLLVHAGRALPAVLASFPPLPLAHGEGPLARALAAVVELSLDDSAGSGTLLSRDGWILTNAHVIEELGGATARDVVVALTLDPHSPPTELFRADVREVDTQRDLALVRVTRGFYGQPLPPDLVFPCVDVDLESEPAIGAPLYLVGYPTTGGQGSRVTVSATRGIVAGYDTAEFGTVLKTDAEITNGNSGGAALDERGRLVGVPTSTVENGSGQIGYVHPVRAMPETWRALVWPKGAGSPR